ncbi:MAG TPA: hydrogenase maturation protease [Polyangiaceae bacterium]
MSLVLVIGFGNRLRQDDAFGPTVADWLEERMTDPQLEVLERSTLTPELAQTLSETRHVIFVDASAELAPGTVERRVISCDGSADVSLVHFLSPEALLVWTERVYGKVPSAEIWLMGVAETGLSETMTPIVQRQVPAFVELIEQHVRDLLALFQA